MKSKLLVSLLTLSLLPAQLCATIVNLEVWQRPNGSRIIVLGDDSAQCPAEKQQAIDCINYLKSLTNPYLLRVRDAASKFASEISNANIPHDVVTFVPDNLNDGDINITPLAHQFLTKARLYEPIPTKLSIRYNALLASFEAHTNALRPIELVPSNPDDFCLQCNPHVCLPSTINPMLDIAQSLFTYMLASRLEHKAAKQSFVLLESSMMNALAQPLQTLGYTRIATFGTFTQEAANALYLQKWETKQALQAQNDNGTCSCCSEEENLTDDLLMEEVMNHFALNLKDIFNHWTPAAKMHTAPHYAPWPYHTNQAPSMTPTEYRAWSKGYDMDMRNENLPIRGFGFN